MRKLRWLLCSRAESSPDDQRAIASHALDFSLMVTGNFAIGGTPSGGAAPSPLGVIGAGFLVAGASPRRTLDEDCASCKDPGDCGAARGLRQNKRSLRS